MLRDEIAEIIEDKEALACEIIGCEDKDCLSCATDRILALFRKLVEGNKLFVCGNIDYQNGYNKALDDLLLELK